MSGLIVLSAAGKEGQSRGALGGRPLRSRSAILIECFLALVCSASIRILGVKADSHKRDVDHLIFEDCGMARMMIGHLSPAELEKALVTLVSTIRLGTRGTGYAATGPGQIGGTGGARIPGHGELAGDIVLMSFDPGRNERARRCSVELLRSFLPERPLVIRELIALADDPDIVGADRALAEEMRGIVVSVAEEVAPEMSRGDAVLVLDSLIREQSGSVLTHWQPLFRLFLTDSLHLISRKYLTSPEFDVSLQELLSALDPSGELSSGLIQEAFLSIDDGGRKTRILAWVERVGLPVGRIMPFLLSELTAGSVKGVSEVLHAIAASLPVGSCHAVPSFDERVPPLVVEAISSRGIVMQEAVRTGLSGIRCVAQCRDDSGQTGLAALWCDRRQLRLYRHIIDELIGSDSQLLGVSWPAIATLPLEQSELEGYLRRSLNSAHRSVRVAAFSIYSEQPIDRGKFVSDALRLLKRPAVTGDEKREIVEQLAHSFVSPPIGIRGLPAVPLFLDSFELTPADCGLLCAGDARRKPLLVQAIGAIGKDAFPLLVRSLESVNKQRRRLALLALGELSPVDERMAYFLVGGLRDSESALREVSQQLVANRRGEVAVRNELTKALKWSDADAAGRAAALLNE